MKDIQTKTLVEALIGNAGNLQQINFMAEVKAELISRGKDRETLEILIGNAIALKTPGIEDPMVVSGTVKKLKEELIKED